MYIKYIVAVHTSVCRTYSVTSTISTCTHTKYTLYQNHSSCKRTTCLQHMTTAVKYSYKRYTVCQTDELGHD